MNGGLHDLSKKLFEISRTLKRKKHKTKKNCMVDLYTCLVDLYTCLGKVPKIL